MGVLFDSSGHEVRLGRKLGTGGEGTVYEILAPSNSLVAKLYHHPPDHSRRDKLIHMVRCSSEQLRAVAAWPLDLLADQSRQVRGFVMPKMVGYEPIHKLYSPAHRKQAFPGADWGFLVNAARNVAAAFNVIHYTGHVIGDVNQGNVFVSSDSRVRLIDCDSFQVCASKGAYLCGVGVPHFTPPELMTVKSYDEFMRTANHDNFGLALLCFHLLFMGRHPFAGVTSQRDALALEKAIENCQFAFSHNPAVRGCLTPPPNSATLDILPPEISGMFEAAFSRDGTGPDRRPAAKVWARAMELLRSALVSCSKQPLHKYYRGLSSCPWCDLEHKSGVLLFIGRIVVEDVHDLPIDEIWNRILSVPAPGPAPVAQPDYIKVMPHPVSRFITIKQIVVKLSAALVLISSVAIAIAIGSFLPIIGGIYFAAIVYGRAESEPVEYALRRKALQHAETEWQQALAKWNASADDQRFKKVLADLVEVKKACAGLRGEYNQAKAALQSRIKEHQLQAFLGRFFIEDSSIPGIGAGRKAVLASFGIETAADVQRDRIMKIGGFGYGLTSNLLAWRADLSRRFVFDSSKGIDPQDLNALNHRFQNRKAQLEQQLRSGPEMLVRAREEILRARAALEPDIRRAVDSVAQARADASVCG